MLHFHCLTYQCSYLTFKVSSYLHSYQCSTVTMSPSKLHCNCIRIHDPLSPCIHQCFTALCIGISLFHCSCVSLNIPQLLCVHQCSLVTVYPQMFHHNCLCTNRFCHCASFDVHSNCVYTNVQLQQCIVQSFIVTVYTLVFYCVDVYTTVLYRIHV